MSSILRGVGLAVLTPLLQGAPLHDEALAAARNATAFYVNHVATEGGFLWRYSADLKLREGEGEVTAPTVWVQPPGTPSMGAAFVSLYEATGEAPFLNAARAAAEALRRGQLRSGGWQAMIEFDPDRRRRWAYLTDPPSGDRRNTSSLDDDKTQSALRFVMRLDRVLKFRDDAVHEMALYALQHLLQAQHPNGAFPQVWDGPNHQSGHAVKPASYPKEWTREYSGHREYWDRYTLNDNLMEDVIDTLFLAADIYDEARFLEAALKAADFLILAQMPEPQPAWAQQYDFDMHPIWARKFEPPAVTGGESQGVMRILMAVYRQTGDPKYLKPIPRALAYLERSTLPDGRLARFYELRTNRPLYFTREYQLTYSDADTPTHYSFKVTSQIDSLRREYRALAAEPVESLKAERRRASPSPPAVRRVLDALDNRGAWVTEGRLRYQEYQGPVIDLNIAVRNLNLLADYLLP